VFLRFKAS